MTEVKEIKTREEQNLLYKYVNLEKNKFNLKNKAKNMYFLVCVLNIECMFTII